MLQLINKRQIEKLKTVAKGGIFLAAVLCFSVCLFYPDFSHAQNSDSTTVETNQDLNLGMEYAQQIGLPSTDIRLIIANIIRIALGLLGLAAVVIILYGGWLWMTAGGNEEQVEKAKKTLINGTIGLAIILSAYGIVIFVMNLLGLGAGTSNNNTSTGTVNTPGIMNMAGSGALGDVIKDHYPVSDQVGVPRNTRLAITFAKPIDLESLTVTSGGKYFLKNDVISIYKYVVSSTSGNKEWIQQKGDFEVQGFPIHNDKSGKDEIYSIAITPKDLLGSGQEEIKYLVRVNNSLQVESGGSIFKNAKCRCSYYQWFFTCSTVEDNDPPHVVDFFPGNGDAVPKNSKIQITFSEAIFPNAQASFTTTSDDDGAVQYYQDVTNKYSPMTFIKSDRSSLPLGSFRIVNQYKTLEFISSLLCGTNACGLPIYCLPVCDMQGADCSVDDYKILFKAAFTTGSKSKPPFYSSAMDGITDMAGNALDDGDNVVENEFDEDEPFSASSIKPDNKYWSFSVTKEMDTNPPYVNYLSLGPGATGVTAKEDLIITWSKRMSYYSLQNISIGEYPSPKNRCTGSKIINCSEEPLGYVPSSEEINNSIVAATTTKTQIKHSPFLDGTSQYYLPEITSGVEDLFGNCFYPGEGPKKDENIQRDVVCDGSDCCEGDYCCNGETGTDSTTCLYDLVSDYQ